MQPLGSPTAATLLNRRDHRVRTAPRDGLRWFEESDGSRSGRVNDYGSEGWRTFHWFGHAAPVRVYHRTVATWVRLLREGGLEPVAIHEPASQEPRDAGNPRFWLIVAENPGPRRSLVTLDGGAASGKTALGEALARRLEWRLVDSGQLQRAFAWRLLRGRHADPVQLRTDEGHTRYYVGAKDVTHELSPPEIGQACAQVAADAAASEELAALLEELSRERCIVTGRAMGRFHPNPLARFFLTAPPNIRAARRGCDPMEILERDRQDLERGRLLPPDIDTIQMDTGTQSVEALVETAAGIVSRRLGGRA